MYFEVEDQGESWRINNTYMCVGTFLYFVFCLKLLIIKLILVGLVDYFGHF